MNQENPDTQLVLNQFADLSPEEWKAKVRDGTFYDVLRRSG